jgi:hypothetical protein
MEIALSELKIDRSRSLTSSTVNLQVTHTSLARIKRPKPLTLPDKGLAEWGVVALAALHRAGRAFVRHEPGIRDGQSNLILQAV